MKVATLIRSDTSDHGTFSVFRSGDFACFISELPWRDNRKQVSCIPEGIYEVKWHRSPKFGWCYRVQNVPSRSEILFHVGNYAGDVSKGFISNSYGCLLPCKKLGKLGNQKAGLLSLPAVRAFNAFFAGQSFTLEIINAFNDGSTS